MTLKRLGQPPLSEKNVRFASEWDKLDSSDDCSKIILLS
jgi:hypothetical protein